jgi:predicted amidophosphoribosyltransferase
MKRKWSTGWGRLQRVLERARALDLHARLVRTARAGRIAAARGGSLVLDRARIARATVSPFLGRLGEACLDLLAPGFCRECGGPVDAGRDPFCPECGKDAVWIGSACARCGTPVVSPGALSLAAPAGCGACARLRLHFDSAAAGARYEGPIRTAVLRFKFERDRGVLPLLRSALLHAAGSPGLRDAVRVAGAIVPLPPHPWKRFLRGADPVRELADALSDDLAPERRIAVEPLLEKVRWTPSQVSLPERARRRNLRDAFRVRRHRVVPATVVLVDDVLTTCTTASRSALALKRGGAETVIVLAVARS